MHGRSVSRVVRELFAFPWTLLTSSLLAPRGGQKSRRLHDKWWRKWDNLFRSLAFCSPTCLLNCFMLFFLIPAARATTALQVVTARQWEEPSEEEAVGWDTHTRTYTTTCWHRYKDGRWDNPAHSDYCNFSLGQVIDQTHKHTHISKSSEMKWRDQDQTHQMRQKARQRERQHIKHGGSFFLNHVFVWAQTGLLWHPGLYNYRSSCLYAGIWPLTPPTPTPLVMTFSHATVQRGIRNRSLHPTSATVTHLFSIRHVWEIPRDGN